MYNGIFSGASSTPTRTQHEENLFRAGYTEAEMRPSFGGGNRGPLGGRAGINRRIESALKGGPPSTGLISMSWDQFSEGVPNVPAPDFRLMSLNSAVPADPTRGEAMRLYNAASEWAPQAQKAATGKASQIQRSFEKRMRNVGGGTSKLARMSGLAEHRRGLQTDLQGAFADLKKAGMDMESAKLSAVTMMDTQRRAHGLQAQSTDLQRQIAQQQATQGRADSHLRAKAQWVNAELQRAQTDANLQMQWINSMMQYSKKSSPTVFKGATYGGGGGGSRTVNASSGKKRKLGEGGSGSGYHALGPSQTFTPLPAFPS